MRELNTRRPEARLNEFFRAGEPSVVQACFVSRL